MNAEKLFMQTLEWLRDNYDKYKFFTERDVVWTVQMHLIDEIKKNNLTYKIYNDWPIEKGERRSRCVDLVIMQGDKLKLAAEFKYEPDHKRKDFSEKKLKQAVVFWKGENSVEKDIGRIKKYVEEDKAKIGYSVFIDEGKRFREKDAIIGTSWHDWNSVSVLIYIKRFEELVKA